MSYSLKLAGAALAGALSLAQANAATITYNLDLTEGTTTIVGTLTTDGTLGALSAANIVDWDITVSLSTISASGVLEGPLSGNNSFISTGFGTGLSATSSALQYNFGGTNSDFEMFHSSTFPKYGFELLDSNDANNPDSILVDYVASSGTTETDITTLQNGGLTTIGTTPLPGALPLFASGLGALGLFGWRRKRRAQPIA